MQAQAAEDLSKIVTDKLVDAGLVYEGAKAFVDAAPARAHRCTAFRRASPISRKRERARGSARRKARSRASSSARGSKSIDEAKIQKDPKKGDFYVALIEKPGRAAIEVIGGNPAGDPAHLPMAEVDALGRARRSPAPDLGAAAAFHRRDFWAGDRRARDRAVRRRRHRGRAATRGHRSWRRRRSGAPLRRLRGEARQGQGRARSGSAARKSSSPTPRTSPSRKATSWSRTRCCSMRWRAWSNGRSC